MKKETKKKESNNKLPLSRTIEESETRCIAYATKLAEQQLAEGTASSQIITHYLKIGSEKARYETERLKYETEMIKAKTEAIKSQQQTDELIRDAVKAFKHYSGNDEEEPDDEYEDD